MHRLPGVSPYYLCQIVRNCPTTHTIDEIGANRGWYFTKYQNFTPYFCYINHLTMTVKYDTIGQNYNNTRRADPFLLGRLVHHLHPHPNGHYLDIGCGTGNYTIEIVQHGLSFVGVDPSQKMLEEARRRSNDITWLQGTAEKIPVGDALFDGGIGTLTIHHWHNLNKAFCEIARVLNPQGRLVLFTSTPGQMEGYWLTHYFPQMLQASKEQMPSMTKICNALTGSGLKLLYTENYDVRDDLQDSFLYVGKNNPERYFDPAVRNGISSFSSLAYREEVEDGLLKLRNDIDNNRFESIKRSYHNSNGDYVFVVLEKEGVEG